MYLGKEISALDAKTYWDTNILRKVEEELRAKAFLVEEGLVACFSETEIVMYHILKQNGFLTNEEEEKYYDSRRKSKTIPSKSLEFTGG